MEDSVGGRTDGAPNESVSLGPWVPTTMMEASWASAKIEPETDVPIGDLIWRSRSGLVFVGASRRGVEKRLDTGFHRGLSRDVRFWDGARNPVFLLDVHHS
jgi:hypothetical protein